MSAPEFRPFGDEHMGEAAVLLASRHARHRAAEPLLADADPEEAIRAMRKQDGVAGTVAVRGGKVVGYVVAEVGEHPYFDHFAWIGRAGHGAADAEVARDLYGAAAERWFEAGATRHFVLVPALSADLDPWYRLGFGHMHVEAIRESGGRPGDLPSGLTIRRGGRDDVDMALRIDRFIHDHQRLPPSFGLITLRPDEEARADWIETLEDPSTGYFVAELNGHTVGHSLLYAPEPDLGVPADAMYLASTATDPEVRGSGIGVALTEHVLAWAEETGHPAVVTNWRMSNLLAERFWRSRGFRPVFHRLHRVIGVG
ncbi:MAG TPA: GNAT family N-acetyltransferase [Actinomycetota bacterium]|nr:GNAT family N-acetyltransferase [Actinomycetota bacterium]